MSLARDVLLENWGTKLMSVFLAFFLWLAVRGEPPAERVITVPLEIVLPSDMEITGERPSAVDLTLRGAPSNMWLSQPTPSCRIDLQDASEGDHTVTLGASNVRLPRAAGLEVVSVRPARVTLTLERTISKVVPIRVARGEPPLDLEVYGVTIAPPTAMVTGPRSHVEKIREVRTENIPLAGQRESFRADARLAMDDGSIHVSPPGAVEVSIQLGVRRQLQTVSRVPVTADDPSVEVKPPRLTLSVLVPMSLQRNLSADEFSATVTIKSLDPAQRTFTVKPEVRLKNPPGPGIVIMQIKPAEVTVRRTGKG